MTTINLTDRALTSPLSPEALAKSLVQDIPVNDIPFVLAHLQLHILLRNEITRIRKVAEKAAKVDYIGVLVHTALRENPEGLQVCTTVHGRKSLQGELGAYGASFSRDTLSKTVTGMVHAGLVTVERAHFGGRGAPSLVYKLVA